jgi:hypothetical protein
MLRTGPLWMRVQSSQLAWPRTTSPKYQDCGRRLALWMSALSPAFKSLRSNRPLTFLALTRRVRRSVDCASWLRRVAFARRLQAAIIGALGSLVGLGGAEFRLPLLSEFSRFAALQPVIPWSASPLPSAPRRAFTIDLASGQWRRNLMKFASSLSYHIRRPELFEPVEEALDDVALLARLGVVGTLNVRFRLGGMSAWPPVRALLSQR